MTLARPSVRASTSACTRRGRLADQRNATIVAPSASRGDPEHRRDRMHSHEVLGGDGGAQLAAPPDTLELARREARIARLRELTCSISAMSTTIAPGDRIGSQADRGEDEEPGQAGSA